MCLIILSSFITVQQSIWILDKITHRVIIEFQSYSSSETMILLSAMSMEVQRTILGADQLSNRMWGHKQSPGPCESCSHRVSYLANDLSSLKGLPSMGTHQTKANIWNSIKLTKNQLRGETSGTFSPESVKKKKSPTLELRELKALVGTKRLNLAWMHSFEWEWDASASH